MVSQTPSKPLSRTMFLKNKSRNIFWIRTKVIVTFQTVNIASKTKITVQKKATSKSSNSYFK